VQHLAMELFKLDAGVNLVHVPYKGLGGMLNDLVGGHVQVGAAALQSVHPHVQAGRLRMLGQLDVETWYAVFAPAGTPPATLAKLNADFDALLQDGQMREFLAKQGMSAAGGSAARLGELVRRELARWTRVVKLAGIKAD
jgi:tripartite-type tricarboxylate transporter receptor subunit TctC